MLNTIHHKYAAVINGSLSGTISVLDRGIAYGDGVFRTLKVVNGEIHQWPLHYQTLVADCSAIGIVCPSAESLMSDMLQLFLPDEIVVIKIMITRGEGERGYAPPAITAPTRIVIKSAMPEFPETHFTEGVHLHLCETRLAHQPKLAGIKHLNRLENVLARMEWNDPAFAEGLLLDIQGNVIECTAANIFARYGDKIITPKLSVCGVAGSTRQRILDNAYTFSLKTKIETFNLETLLSADEVIICNSLYGALQVLSISNRTWPKLNLAADIRRVLSL